MIIDVAALDVLDSYGSKALRDLTHMARLRGATTVLVGIQPDVAFSVIRPGMNLDIHTALDLEQGLNHLEPVTTDHRATDSALNAIRNPTAGE